MRRIISNVPSREHPSATTHSKLRSVCPRKLAIKRGSVDAALYVGVTTLIGGQALGFVDRRALSEISAQLLFSDAPGDNARVQDLKVVGFEGTEAISEVGRDKRR
jgi:hypothetical protein